MYETVFVVRIGHFYKKVFEAFKNLPGIKEVKPLGVHSIPENVLLTFDVRGEEDLCEIYTQTSRIKGVSLEPPENFHLGKLFKNEEIEEFLEKQKY